MTQTLVRIIIAALAFFLGVTSHAVWVRFHSQSSKIVVRSMTSRAEEWHRLYEAAGMTGDAGIRNEVSDRLLCANSAGVPDAWPVEIEARSWCRKADGSIHELREIETSEYGSFSYGIKTSHRTWVLNNMDFVAGLSNARRAEEYVLRHKWPSDQ